MNNYTPKPETDALFASAFLARVRCNEEGHKLIESLNDRATKLERERDEARKERHAELAAAGIAVHVVRALDAAMNLVHAWRTGWKPEPMAIKGRPVMFGGKWFEERDGQLHPIAKEGEAAFSTKQPTL